MDRQTSRLGRAKRLKVLARAFAISFVSVCALSLSITKGPQLAKSISQQFVSRLRLEHVEWEEVGRSNLSRLVNSDVLWKASGLQIQDEILSLKLETLEEKLRTVPWLESIQIQRKLPSTLVVRYTVHSARALAVKKGRLWAVAESGEWIAPLGKLNLDLPVIIVSAHDSTGESMASAIHWIEALEKNLAGQLAQIQEVNMTSLKSHRLSILVDLKYSSHLERVHVIGIDEPHDADLIRLKQVVQYLIKNNVLVSTIDLRPGKKVVVNVGKHP